MSAARMQYGLNHELQEYSDSWIIFSPYVTFWAEGNYYILAKREGQEELEHFRIDMLRDIAILERGVDMLFGGFNPNQYAEKYIIQNGENKEHYEIECQVELWQDIIETFGQDAMVIKKDHQGNMLVRIVAIPSKMKAWVMLHMEECEVLSTRRFRDELQNIIMSAYRKYFGQKISKSPEK